MSAPSSQPSPTQHDRSYPTPTGETVATFDAGRNGGKVSHLARGLGWFSLGLGVAQLAAPRKVAHLVGIAGSRRDQWLMRLLGLREMTSGIGILTQSKPGPWLWGRVGGDAMDLALLGSALVSPASSRGRVAVATVAVLGVTAADAFASTRMAGEPAAATAANEVHATAAVTINAPVAEVYRFWEGFQQLPRFMRDAASVQVTGDGRSHWTLSAPAGIRLDWDVEITEWRANERIAWRAADGSPMDAAGEVRFRAAPGNRGTEVVFDARFRPPGGELGRTVGEFLAEVLGTKLGNDLRRCKQLIELGEIVQSDDSIVPGPNSAQPQETVPVGAAVPGTGA